MEVKIKQLFTADIKLTKIITKIPTVCYHCLATYRVRKVHRTGHNPYQLPREIIIGDLVNLKLLKTGVFLYLFTLIDWGSKYAWCYAIPNKESTTVIACLNKAFFRHKDRPFILKFDNGGECTSKEMKVWAAERSIQLQFGRRYTPTD